MVTALLACAAIQTHNGFDLSYHGKGKTIATPDGKLYYEKTGTGPVVVMIAGGPGGSHASFHGFFERLAKDHTVVMFDNIGRGRSARLKDKRRYTVERDADDIEALRKHLGVAKISLIGHSYGGMPAIAYAVKYGAHVDRAVLSDTLHSGPGFQQNIDSCNFNVANQFPEKWATLTAMRKKGVKTSSEAYENLYGECMGDLYWFDPASGSKMWRSGDKLDGSNNDVYVAMIGDDAEWKVGGTMRGWDWRKRFKNVTSPILVCVGRYDRVATPKVSYEMTKLFSRARLQVFEKSGHRPWVEETDAYFRAVEAFLK